MDKSRRLHYNRYQNTEKPAYWTASYKADFVCQVGNSFSQLMKHATTPYSCQNADQADCQPAPQEGGCSSTVAKKLSSRCRTSKIRKYGNTPSRALSALNFYITYSIYHLKNQSVIGANHAERCRSIIGQKFSHVFFLRQSASLIGGPQS